MNSPARRRQRFRVASRPAVRDATRSKCIIEIAQRCTLILIQLSLTARSVRAFLRARKRGVEALALWPPCRAAACSARSARRISSRASRTARRTLGAHHVDVGQRAARERRKAKAEDRADIRLAHVGDTPSSKQRAVSSAWIASRRCFNSCDVDRRRDRASSAAGRRDPATASSAACRIVVEALAVLAAERPCFSTISSSSFFCRGSTASAPRSASVGACTIFQAEIDRRLVVERQRPDRHAGHAAGILDHRRRHAFGQHQMAFADVVPTTRVV